MQNVVIHPDTDQLAAFVHGKPTEVEADEIADHLAECEACRKLVDTVPDDALLGLLRPLLVPGQQPTSWFPVESWVPSELAGHSRYRLQQWIGAGGMGVVYKAEHRLMERSVALKVIRKNLTVNSRAVERFQREVKAAAKLSHPNIVTAYDAERAGDLHFLIMEFIEGVSLARMVEDVGPLPVEAACDYVRQAALGLHHAFECGMVHRDMKPQNLMLTPKGQVKILDFGLAGFVSEGGPVGSLTEFGQGLGTPDYVAPEQIRNAHSADVRADIYSLGCTLYYLLTGQPPFPEGSGSQKIAAHLERSPMPISGLRRGVPDSLVQVTERMMAKEPAQRYQTPAEVAEALAALIGSDPTPARNFARNTWLMAGTVALAAGVGLAMLYSPGQGPQIAKDGPKAQNAAGPNPTRGTTPGSTSATSGAGLTGEKLPPNKVVEDKRLSSDDGKDFVK